MQPRGTHGDVISTTGPETYYNPAAVLQPRSHSVPMHEWPILLGLSLGKSLSIPITAFPLAHAPLASTRAPNWNSALESISSEFLSPPPLRSFTYLSTYLYTLTEFAEQRFHFSLALGTKMTGSERRRNASCVADFFHYDSLNHNPPR